MAKYLGKGSLIAVEGRIQSRQYQAQDGTTRTQIEVVADGVQFLDTKSSSNETPQVTPQQTETKAVDISSDDLP
jgi:single-strand DNA-binding protein